VATGNDVQHWSESVLFLASESAVDLPPLLGEVPTDRYAVLTLGKMSQSDGHRESLQRTITLDSG